jgi:hypothetical protein
VPGASAPEDVRVKSFQLLLDVIGLTGDDVVTVCHNHDGRFTVTVGDATTAASRARPFIGRADVWFGVAPLRERPRAGRGTAADVARLTALFADLDHKPGALTPEQSAKVIGTLSALLGTPPAAVVQSGHGLQPYWPVKDTGDDLDRSARTLARWGRLVAQVAGDHGGTVDNVYDLARILRVPGTVNLKDPDRPVDVTLRVVPDHQVLTLDHVEDVLDLAAIGPPPGGAREPVQPAGTWQWGESTCSYVQLMVKGWSGDTPSGGRHYWLLAQAIRLQAAHRAGCITEPDHADAVRRLERAFTRIVGTVGQPRQPRPGEVAGALADAVRLVETKTDEQVAAELGGHTHGDRPADPLADLEDRVFVTDRLRHVRQAARAAMVGPWAVLGSALCRVVADIPPHVVIPGIIGSPTGANIALAVVGLSGAGKSAANRTARDVLPPAQARPVGPGTGEGLIQTFLVWDRDQKRNVAHANPRAYLYADEIDQIDAIQTRNGATFGAIVRSMLMGEDASNNNADPERNRHLPALTYRVCMVAGVQPARSGVLLNDADVGTPQRWLWLPAGDLSMPDQRPPWPGRLHWTPPPTPTTDRLTGHHIPDVDPRIADYVEQQHRLRVRTNGAAGDNGHAILTRLKWTFALAVLHGQTDLSRPMWDVAGALMEASDRTRAACLTHLAQQSRAEQRRKGDRLAEQEAGYREARAAQGRKWAELLWKQVARHSDEKQPNQRHEPGDGCTLRCLGHALRHHPDADRALAVEVAEDNAWLDKEGDRWRPGPSQPM